MPRRYDDDYDRPYRRRDEDDPPSRRRYDDDDRSFRRDEEEDDFRFRRDRDGFRCPYCRSSARPYVRSQISPAGWAVFAIMMFVCTPLFFIGLLMTEEYRECADCGLRLN